MTRNARMDIAVVGGGVAGLVTAWRLAQARCTVTVFDASSIPARDGAATWASAGMIAARLEMARAPAPLKALALSARAAWPAFAGEIERAADMDCGYLERGALHAVFEGEPFPDDFEGVELIDAASAHRLEPGLAKTVRGAAWAPDEAHVDPRWLALALFRACRSAGVAFEAGMRVERLVETGGAVTGLVAGGRRGFDHVVLAAGAWSGSLLELSNLPGPRIRPVKGQMLSLNGAGPTSLSRPVWTADAYIVPHADGRIVIGATLEEAGFDLARDDAALDALKAEAVRTFPGLGDLPELERFCGFRPVADDDLPVLGGIGIPGLTLASGQYRNGILLAPLVADAAAQHVLQGRLPALARPFAAARFAEAAA